MKERSRTQMLTLAAFAAVLAIVVAAVLIGRGGGDEESSDALTDTSVKPVVEVSNEPAPAELVTEDIVEGDGPAAAAGDQISVQYVGVDYVTGEQFDASWDNGAPFDFELGSGSVIPGWDEGIVGMKVGGRRELVIPPDLAYGPQGQPPDIGPDATLVFVVDLLSVE